MKIINYLSLFALVLLFSYCTNNNQAPSFELSLVTTPSDKWETASIDIESLIFTFDAAAPALSGSGQRTRNWDGVSVSQDLTTPQNDNVSSFQHLEMTATGIRPDWEITLFDSDMPDSKIVNTDQGFEFLSLPTDIVLENGKSYDIVLTIDPDVAFLEGNDVVQLNLEGVSVTLTEQ